MSRYYPQPKSTVKFGGYEIDSATIDGEYLLPIGQAISTFYDLDQEYQAIKEKWEQNRYMLEQMCQKAYEEIGFKSLKDEYTCVTFVPGTEGKVKIEKRLNEIKVVELLKELGYDDDEIEQYYIVEEKTTGSRKPSIRMKERNGNE